METGAPTNNPTGRYVWSAAIWALQAVSGVLLVVLGGVHMLAQHFAGRGLLTYEEVIAWLHRPEVFLLETIFLGVVLAHVLAGIHSILMDLGWGLRAEKRASVVVAGTGVILFVYATSLMWSVAYR